SCSHPTYPFASKSSASAPPTPSTPPSPPTWSAPPSPPTGFPTWKSPDHHLLPTPRRLSQVAPSFIGAWCLGIHLTPLVACLTYDHTSHVEGQVADKILRIAVGFFDKILDFRPVRLSMCWWR